MIFDAWLQWANWLEHACSCLLCMCSESIDDGCAEGLRLYRLWHPSTVGEVSAA